MQYSALYRRMRPNRFSGVVGQEHITRTLINQIKTNRVSHAYLFCGTRGTGKTSTAKIFAKAVNCENSADGEPCGVCRSCVEIAGQTGVNVIEIDAASNNGVDNIRDIRDEVKYPPVGAKYKVYIIDEAHMLSAGAFNALLKTLEEPPAHIIFILATTNPLKIPATIQSRCQRFDFKRVSARDEANLLKSVVKSENIDADDDALAHIAFISDGSLRDALSILDQCVSFYYGEKITAAKAREITGSTDSSAFFSLTDAIFARDAASCLAIIDDAVSAGRDISQFVTEYIVHLRNLLIMAAAPEASRITGFSDENARRMRECAAASDPADIIKLITLFSQLDNRLKYSSNGRIALEVCCISACVANDAEIEDIKKETRTIKANKKTVNKNPEKQAPKDVTETKTENARTKAVPDDIKAVMVWWDEFVKNFSGMEAAFLKETKPGYLENEFLYIVCDSISAESILKKREENVKQKLFDLFGKEFNIRVIFKSAYDDMHKKQFGAPDDFQKPETGEVETALGKDEIEKIKKALNIEIIIE